MALTEEGIIYTPGLLSRWVRLPSSVKAHYVTSGETGPAVILLHGGLPGSSGTAGWRFNAPSLGANGFRVYCLDRPGFGLTEVPPDYWEKKTDVDFIDEFADAVCIDRFHLSGNSLGAAATAQYVLSHPERVISFVLITGGGLGDLTATPGGARNGRFGNHDEFDGTEESMRRIIDPIVYRKEAMTDDLLRMRTLSATRQREALAASDAARARRSKDPNLIQKTSAKGRFEHLTIPGIFVHGKNDTFSSVEGSYTREPQLTNLQFFYPDDCGHQAQTDQPEVMNQLFLEFFRDGRVSRATADRAGVSTRRPEIPTLVEQVGERAASTS